MTRLEKLEAVAAAARALREADAHGDKAGCHVALDRMDSALLLLDAALDAPDTAAETETLAVWESLTGRIDLCAADSPSDNQDAYGVLWRRKGTVTLPITRERGE